LLDEQLDLTEPEHPVELPVAGDLVVEKVSFQYAPQLGPVLRDVSLSLENGKRLVLVGPTGAGKSTLAKLMARFYDPTEGTISFGGVDLREMTGDAAQEHRRHPTRRLLFTGTIRDNLLMAAPDADDADPERARRSRLTVRFDTSKASTPWTRGTNFSAGERQLVARAGLIDPSVPCSTRPSSLDPGTELLLDRARERSMACTVVVIAHRHHCGARRHGGRGRRRPPRRSRPRRAVA
jgi:ATP-binding cassette subfamily B protein